MRTDYIINKIIKDLTLATIKYNATNLVKEKKWFFSFFMVIIKTNIDINHQKKYNFLCQYS